MLLKIQGYDVILGMDWLVKHKATIDYERKLLTSVTPEGEKLVYKRNNYKQTIPIISATRACRMLKKGCPTYLWAVEIAETQELDPREIPIVP